LESIRGALDAGAVGVVIGRNVWQATSPTGMTQALVALVHHDVSVDDALHMCMKAGKLHLGTQANRYTWYQEGVRGGTALIFTR